MKDVTQLITLPDGRYEKEYSDGAVETGSLAFVRDSDKAVVDKFGSPVSGGGAGTASGTLSSTPTTISLSALSRVGVWHNLGVAPAAGATITVQVSTDGGTTYATAKTTTVTEIYQYVLYAGETPATHIKLSASTGTTSTYCIF